MVRCEYFYSCCLMVRKYQQSKWSLIKNIFQTGMADEKFLLKTSEASFRRVAFVSISLSTFATLVCVISVPLFCNYLQTMNAVLQNEVDFCKLRSANIWKEVTRTQVSYAIPITLSVNFFSKWLLKLGFVKHLDIIIRARKYRIIVIPTLHYSFRLRVHL